MKKSIITYLLFIVLLAMSCGKDDPCESISCINGGTCVNGVCDCPDRYTGPDCSKEMVPRSMTILSVTVTGFPATDSNGGGWDLASGADLYFVVTRNNTILYTHPTFIQNASPTEAQFFLSTNIFISDPGETYEIGLFDHDDFDADDFIAGVSFTPHRDNQGFPNMYDLDTGVMSVRLRVDYIF